MPKRAAASQDGAWPCWPRCDDGTVDAVNAVLRSGRWAISGPATGEPLRERTFAQQWSQFVGASTCVPTANGTSALTIALEAMGIGYGDEVLVPALTWVACANAVVNVNATPVLVDIDADTLCMDPEDAAKAITRRTRAIMAVHVYGSMADMDALRALASAHGLWLLEDAAHVHGAAWRGRRAGSLGDCSAFSMQQTKLLTCGEGGAAMTSDGALGERLAQLRADARRYVAVPPQRGELELEPGGGVQGTNYCLSEIHAAMLIAQLESLPALNARRAATAARLDEALGALRGVTPQAFPSVVTERAFYHYAFRCDRRHFEGRTAVALREVLSAKLGFPVEGVYPPLHRSPLWLPESKKRFQLGARHRQAIRLRSRPLPRAEAAGNAWLSVHHRFLLAAPRQALRLAEAVDSQRSARR